jgi:hypothetical protein
VLLSNNKSNSLTLELVEYKYNIYVNNKFDANWLNVQIEVRHPDGVWTAQDSCLQTFELENLLQWFETVKSHSKTIDALKFIEPNLEFHIIHNTSGTLLRVYFETIFRPQWASWNGIMKDLWLDFDLEELDLEEICKSIEAEIQRFPTRLR